MSQLEIAENDIEPNRVTSKTMQFKQETAKDSVLASLCDVVTSGWPAERKETQSIKTVLEFQMRFLSMMYYSHQDLVPSSHQGSNYSPTQRLMPKRVPKFSARKYRRKKTKISSSVQEEHFAASWGIVCVFVFFKKYLCILAWQISTNRGYMVKLLEVLYQGLPL